MKTAITKITLKLNGIDVEVTPDEARKLRNELNALFGAEDKTPLDDLRDRLKQLEDKKPDIQYVPMTYPQPIIIERENPYWQRPGVVWCGDPPNLGTPVCSSSTGQLDWRSVSLDIGGQVTVPR